jgi:hypothetical protein
MSKQLLDAQSALSSKSELDLFTVPPTQIQVEQGYWEQINPTNPVRNEGPYTFTIPGGPQFIQWNKNYLFMRFRILKKGDDNKYVEIQDDDQKVAPVNLIGKTLFKQMKVYIQGNEVFDSGDMYAHRAYLETLLNYGWDAKTSHLETAMYTDEAKPVGNQETEQNYGWAARYSKCKNSTFVETMAPLHCDLFNSDRNLLNHTDVKIELHRNNDKFALLNFNANPTEYIIDLDQVTLFIRKVDIAPSAALAIEQTLQRHMAKYPMRRIKLKRLHINEGMLNTPLHSLFTGQLPRRLVVGCIAPTALYGNYKQSPFKFHNYNVKCIQVMAGGEFFPKQPLECNFEKNLFTRAYAQFFEDMDYSNEFRSCNITMADFKEHFCLYVFNLTADGSDDDHLQVLKEGSTSIELQLSQAAPQGGIEVIVYAEMENNMSIDRHRNVSFDYAA